MQTRFRIGMDVGSTTVKTVMLDMEGEPLMARYERHNANATAVIREHLAEAIGRIGRETPVGICVTGSVGMQTAERMGAEFVQEVVAATRYARKKHPEAKALIDIGGEDSKVVLLEGGHPELRMNGNCAGGTGAFIDQMAALLGMSHAEMDEAARRARGYHTIAARCGVFAKTDVQNLVSRNVDRKDICASIFHSIAVQVITTLAHGQKIEPKILLCGGPLTFLPALREAFAEYMGLTASDFIVSEEGNLVPAIGCALSSGRVVLPLGELLDRLGGEVKISVETGIAPLFETEGEWQTWQQNKRKYDLEVADMHAGKERIVIGIDSGSTTTKIVGLRADDGQLIFTHYKQSLGNPIGAVEAGLYELEQKALAAGADIEVVGSCSTGYGEELIKAAFGLDHGIVETMAHYEAAQRMMEGVSFVLDIGGQDMKAIFVEKGVVTRMELNEACSSGCGTFLQTFAQSLGMGVEEFARIACTAKHPSDLGTRCTVFMNSKIKQVLREGARVEDIAAGLAYSVVNNCLYKVLKLKNTDEMGANIVVQGGTMKNDAVVRALEKLTGREVARSNHPELMGAYGCALHALHHMRETGKTLGQMRAASKYETREMKCGGCENACEIVRYRFGGGETYVSGNKCERIFSNNGAHTECGRNIYTEKYKRLFDRKSITAERKIGIPRALNLYENYPFWHRLLTDCGLEVVLSSDSKMGRYEGALCSVMSDNICFPAKLTHSHIEDLERKGVERILMPYVVREKKESKTAIDSYNCPIVSGYSDVIRSAMNPGVKIDAPVINFSNAEALRQQVVGYLRSIGIKGKVARQAFENAVAAQATYEHEMQQTAAGIYADGRKAGHLVIVLAGRPYHTDPLIQHRIGDAMAGLGIDVISEDIVRGATDAPEGETNTVRQWAYVNRIIKAAEWAARQDDGVQFVEMTSFGCGPDAFIQDEVRELLERREKPLTLLKIDDVTNIGSLKLRVRSLVESLRLQNEMAQARHEKPFRTTEVYRRKDREKTILAPFISEFVTPLLPAVGALAGYTIEVLPPSDEESARIGLQYANNEVCYPATLVVGDIIRALQTGGYRREDIVAAMSQTGGQCRATNYAGLIKRAMVQAGYADIPLVTLGVTAHAGGANEQEGFDIPWRKIAGITIEAMLYADVMAKFYYAAVVRETEAGGAARLRDMYLEKAAQSIRHNDRKRLIGLVEEAARDFGRISAERETEKVGIVGEIFLKFNHFAHQDVVGQLIERGYEVVPPLITPFFLQDFVNTERSRKMGLKTGGSSRLTLRMIYLWAWQKVKKYNAAGRKYKYFVPFTDIYDEAKGAEGIVSAAAQFGEGWYLPAEIVGMVRHGVRNVLSLQPFGCIANHVIARGVENAIKRKYPELNLLSIDFDSGVSRVNVTNRLLLFIAGIEDGRDEQKA